MIARSLHTGWLIECERIGTKEANAILTKHIFKLGIHHNRYYQDKLITTFKDGSMLVVGKRNFVSYIIIYKNETV